MRRRDFLAASTAIGSTITGLQPASAASNQQLELDNTPSGRSPRELPERCEIRIAVELAPMFQPPDTEMIHLIKRLRRDLQLEGIHLPLVRIRDANYLTDGKYVIMIHGDIVGTARLQVDSLLGVNLGGVASPYAEEATNESLNGLRSVWVAPEDASRARADGYHVLRPAHAMLTHLERIVRSHTEFLNSDPLFDSDNSATIVITN